jgi:hypothetical protein
LNAIAARTVEAAEKQRQLELALQQARYEADPARRQYDAVDPDSRLVAGELERRWNEKLREVRGMRLGADLEQAWSHPAATTATRQEDRAGSAERDSGTDRRWLRRFGPALAGRRPHGVEGELQWKKCANEIRATGRGSSKPGYPCLGLPQPSTTSELSSERAIVVRLK